MKSQILVVASLACLTLYGCSAASTLSALKLDSLKGIEFGQSESEVKDALKNYQLTPQLAVEKYKSDLCDGLVVNYEGVQFEPRFIFRDGKLDSIDGVIADISQPQINQLSEKLTKKFGAPRVHADDKVWQDQGVSVFIASRDGNVGGNYNVIGFGAPTAACLAANSIRTKTTHQKSP